MKVNLEIDLTQPIDLLHKQFDKLVELLKPETNQEDSTLPIPYMTTNDPVDPTSDTVTSYDQNFTKTQIEPTVESPLQQEVDAAGVKWDPELHSSTKSKTVQGFWTKRRNRKTNKSPSETSSADVSDTTQTTPVTNTPTEIVTLPQIINLQAEARMENMPLDELSEQVCGIKDIHKLIQDNAAKRQIVDFLKNVIENG